MLPTMRLSWRTRLAALTALVVWIGAIHHDVWLGVADFSHHHGHSHEAPPPEQPRDPREHHCSVDCLCKKADPNCPKPEVPVPTFAGWLESPEFAVTLTAPVSNRRVEPHPPPDLSGRQLRDHISSWLC